MSALTSLLVRDEVVSVQQIEDALQRQVLEGGEIDTALLEQNAIRENVLNAYRAASFGLSPVSRDELMAVPRSIIEQLPMSLATAHRIVPVSRRDNSWVVACAHPLTDDATRAIEAQLYSSIEWRIATEVRVEAALGLHYGSDIAPRMRRLAEQLATLDAGPLPSVEGGETLVTGASDVSMFDEPDDIDDAETRSNSALPLPPPTIVTEHGVGASAIPRDKPVAFGRVLEVKAPSKLRHAPDGSPDKEDPTQPTLLAPPRLPREARIAEESARGGSGAHGGTDGSEHGSARPRVRRASLVPKGPLTKDTARELLDNANDRDEVVDVFFNFARQYFVSTVLFAVREDRALGLESHNTPGVPDVHEVSILFERGGTLEELTRSLAPRVVDLSRKEADHALPLALERMSSQPAALIPVCIRQRMVSLVYGDRDGEPFRVDDIADLVELLPSVSQAFERIIRARKMFAMRARRSSAPPPADSPAARVPRSSSVAPRASWAAPSPDDRAVPATPPPSSIAGVFPVGASLRPHEVDTPYERNRKSVPNVAPTPTLSGIPAAGPGKRTPTSRDVPGIGSAPPPPMQSPPTAAVRSAEAKRALTSLGVPRTAPPPPSSRKTSGVDFASSPRQSGTNVGISREELERNPTVRFPAQSTEPPEHVSMSPKPAAASPSVAPPSSAHYSKPPPGAGSYRSAVAGDDSSKEKDTSPSFPSARQRPSQPSADTRPIRSSRPMYQALSRAQEPDPNEPPESVTSHESRPPARSSKQPPGTGGLYKSQGRPSEHVSLTPSPKAPEAAGRSSNPPSTYSSRAVSPEVVSIPPPPRVPTGAAADGGDTAGSSKPPASLRPPRAGSSPITQPLTPKRASKQPLAADARRDAVGEFPEEEIVRLSKAVRDSLRAPAPVPASQIPSIIVDNAAQVLQLVDDLCRCGPDDESRFVEGLLRHGDEALPLLVEHFPGPLWFDRRKAHPRVPMGRDVSAIARALSAFGERAWPHLATLLTSWDVETRFYATLLVSDQVLPPLLSLLAERLFDTDPQIRLIVKDTLPQYKDVAGFADVARLLRERAADARASIQDRLAALDAIAALRDVGSVPLLIRSNEDPDRQISLPAHRALVTITGQDFSTATRKWNAWYEDNRARHRVEWLIDSLMHSEQALRATSGIELQKLTQVYYGYVAAASKRERERAQKRYLDWWNVQGKKKLA